MKILKPLIKILVTVILFTNILQATIFTQTQQIVAQYYIASLGRSPDSGGLDYWSEEIDNGNRTVNEVRDMFLDRSIPEVANRFPQGQSALETVEAIYLNIFGREGDSGGLEYWAGRINGTIEGQVQLGDNELISTMLEIAKASENYLDGEYLTQRLEDAENEYTGDNTSIQVTYKIVDTAQTKCYDSTSGVVKNCGTTGYDASYSGNQPSYTVSSSGKIITDNVTSLMWTQSSDTNGDGITTDVNDKKSYADSVSYCSALSLDGYDDWRLPDIKTLYSLILFTGEDPSSYMGNDTSSLVTFLDTKFAKAFGDENSNERIIDGQYATTTKYVSTTMNGDETMFGVNFVDGRIKGYPLTMRDNDKLFYVLCTRGNTDYGKNNFSANNDKTITDNSTLLMWEQNDSQSTDFENAISICETSTTAGYTNWRLPNVKELQSILDYTKSPDTTSSCAIDSLFNSTSFLNEDGIKDWGYYWSSTTHVNSGGNGVSGSYVSFGRALGNMNNSILDVHGAGSQRSNNKQSESSDSMANAATDASDGSTYYYKGPQGDILRINNMVRCVRDTNTTTSNTDISSDTTNSVSDGYILLSTMGSRTTQLIDNDKNSVKTWSSDYGAGNAAYLTSSNTLLRAGTTLQARNGTFSNGGGVGGIIEEFSDTTTVSWFYKLHDDTATFHHDFKQINSDNIIALTWELKSYNGVEYWNEKIVKINKSTSSIIWEWSAMDDGGLLPTADSKTDFLHFNSIDYKNGQILVSAKNLNSLILIRESDKSIVSTLTASNKLDGQHDASFLDNENILVFNNMATGTVSEVLELDLSDNIIWEYSNELFYANHISGTQRLDNGNTLICYGTEGKLVEVDQNKNIVWEYTNSFINTTPNGDSTSVFKIRKYSGY